MKTAQRAGLALHILTALIKELGGWNYTCTSNNTLFMCFYDCQVSVIGLTPISHEQESDGLGFLS